jgi:hypothetical protein
VSTRAIRTSTPQTTCDVCGRTLLRGERAETYIGGGDRHSVCELCTSRALHGGWVREGTMPDYESADSRVERRRGLFGRRRTRRDSESADLYGAPEEDPFADETPPLTMEAPEPLAGAPGLDADDLPEAESPRAPAPEWPDTPARPERRPARRRRFGGNGAGKTPSDGDGTARPAREPSVPREPRHVRAVPTGIENRIASAIALFNDSEHPKTVAGIARSLGLPDVAVHPRNPVASAVDVVVSWELCWYRYEVDLSDEIPSVRAAGQGYELDELSALERQINATADDRGQLDLGRTA